MLRLIAVAYSDLGVISTGFATRSHPSVRHAGHSGPCRMWRRHAQREWHMRANARPPQSQQVRPRSDLLSGESDGAGLDIPACEAGDHL